MNFGRFLLDHPNLYAGVWSQSRLRATLQGEFCDPKSVCSEHYGAGMWDPFFVKELNQKGGED